MAKRRIKNLQLEFSKSSEGYLTKSGVCSKSIKSILSDSINSSVTKYNEYFHRDRLENVDLENKSLIFDDQNTIVFEDRSIIPTLGIEEKYFRNDSTYENLLLHTPNSFGFKESESITANPNSSFYNKTIFRKNQENDPYPFKESSINDFLAEDNKYNIIEIPFEVGSKDIDEDDPLEVDPITGKKISNIYLTLNRNSSNSSEQIVFKKQDQTDQVFRTFSGNTVYLYNQYATKKIYNDSSLDIYWQKASPYDYLGGVSNAWLNLDSDVLFNHEKLSNPNLDKEEYFLRSNTCFSNLTPYLNYADYDMSDFNFESIPLSNFGFPYDNKFKGEDRHQVKMKDFITKPFVLESVVFEGEISNWSANTAAQPDQVCLNVVNLFILNQRGSLNPDSLERSVETTKYFREDIDDVWFTEPSSINYEEDPEFTNGYETLTALRIRSYITRSNASKKAPTRSGITPLDRRKTKTTQRELVTNISIVNYANNSSVNEMFNVENIRKNADLFIDKSGDALNWPHYTSQCIYENMPVRIESKVKNYYLNKNLPMMSKYNLMVERRDFNRTNSEKRTERSVTNKSINLSGETVIDNFTGVDVLSKEKNSYESSYILYPEDCLIFGFTLTPSLLDKSVNRAGSLAGNGDDVFVISSKGKDSFKILLKGYYLENKNKKVIIQKSSSKNNDFGFYEKEVVDTCGMPSVHLNKGSYFDHEPTGNAGENNDNSMYKYSSRVKSGFNNLLSIPNYNTNINTYDSEIYYENDIDEELNNFKFLKKYFNLMKFGQQSDFLSYFTYLPYIDTSLQNIQTLENRKEKNHSIRKKFMKGFYMQKELQQSSAILKFDFSKLDNFGGSNFLKEKIFSSFVDKSTNNYALSFSIKDNLENEVNFAIIPQGASWPDGAYSVLNPGKTYSRVNLGYGSKDYIVIIIKNEIVDAFDRVINQSNQLASYSEDLEYRKNQFLDTVIEGINNASQNIQYREVGLHPNSSLQEPKDFKIKVEAEKIVKEERNESLEIKIKLIKAGSVLNASLFNSNFPTDVIFENFGQDNIDIFNSYNTDENAYYPTDEIFYLER